MQGGVAARRAQQGVLISTGVLLAPGPLSGQTGNVRVAHTQACTLIWIIDLY